MSAHLHVFIRPVRARRRKAEPYPDVHSGPPEHCAQQATQVVDFVLVGEPIEGEQ
jgi:hypothetical protein